MHVAAVMPLAAPQPASTEGGGPHPPKEFWHRASASALLRNFVFGSADGLVTVMSFVAGVSASMGERKLVLLAGLAEMFAGAFSMGLGALLGTRAEVDLYARERAREVTEIRTLPDHEREELREIYRRKGFSGDELERVVATLTANEERWTEVMMTEELGMQPIETPAWQAGLVVGSSYIVAAAVPLLPYVFVGGKMALLSSLLLTTCALGFVGFIKSRFTQRPIFQGVVETCLLGLAGTAVCFLLGRLGAGLIR